MRARSAYGPDQRDWNADDRDDAADYRDFEAEERDRLAEVRARDAADREGLLRNEIRVIRRLLWEAEARDALLEARWSGDGTELTEGGDPEQTEVDLAVARADRRLTGLQIRDCLDRMDRWLSSGGSDRCLTERDREAAADDRRSAAGDRLASSGDRDQAAIERAQSPGQPTRR